MGINTAIINQAREILDNAPIPVKARMIWHDGQFYKVCIKCEEIKDLSEFYRDDRSIGGYQHQCRLCQKERRIRAQNKVNEIRKSKRHEMKSIRQHMPSENRRTCGFYNPDDKVVWLEDDLRNVYALWARVVEVARHGINGGGVNNFPPNPHFFKDKHGVFAWLCDHLGINQETLTRTMSKDSRISSIGETVTR